MTAEAVTQSTTVPSPAVQAGALASPVPPHQPIRAVLFDLDGTLYRQRPVQRRMAIELLTLFITHPTSALRRLRGIREFRRAQESLRHGAGGRSQLDVAAERSGMGRDELARLVDEWMIERPLKHLVKARAAGLLELLAFLESQHLRIGVFSDYPAAAKLRALGVEGRFSPVLCATDPAIGAFKPDPRGFLVACERWGLSPHEVLMVGDRLDVDAAGASAAGMPCVIISSASSSDVKRPGLLVLPSLERLHRVIAGHH